MDTKEIKRQIEYWEAVLKNNEKQIKYMTDENKQIKATLKFLRAKISDGRPEKAEADTVGWDNGDYPGQSKREYDEVHGGE